MNTEIQARAGDEPKVMHKRPAAQKDLTNLPGLKADNCQLFLRAYREKNAHVIGNH